MGVMDKPPRPSFLAALNRGLKGRCPACGDGKLFWRYLKVEPQCPVCGHDLAQYPADDGPAYFTILIVGHLVIAPLLLFPFIWQAPVALVLAVTLLPLAGATLILLPRIKGAFIGALYALGVKERDAAMHTADAAD
ncbi:MAG: DUF983 domain-containing protein [Phenylobacterium sp.]|uniref:DUF983 domain-containing protein n=1 Tax=Phenylobacterium sp. TaxID=1871053 RepID=UPI002721129F|nr:DUF983 domain-containing protein [Phenylobacterium sp.]MDO8901376.1 DUF983 domain-containing protein [Phenylobacterium sp.]MDP2212512.1 DUF983 domain-containing protein [Phenylobacterium sp.]